MALAGQLAHGQVLQDPLLDLVQPEVVLVEDGAGALQVEVVLAGRGPGQVEHPVEVGADHGALGRFGMHLLQALDVLLGLLVRRLGHAGLFQLLQVDADLLHVLGLLAQLLADGLELLAQEVFLLVLVHLALGLEVDLVLHVQHLDLVAQELVDLGQPAQRVGLLEDGLRVLDLQLEVGGDDVGQLAGLLDVLGDDQDLVGDLLAQLAGLLELLAQVLDHGLVFQGQLGRLLVLHRPHLGLQDLAVVVERLHAHAGDALDQHAHAAVGQLEHAHDQGHGAEAVELVLAGVLHVHVLLGQQQDQAVAVQGGVDGLLGLRAADVQGDDHVGEDHDVAQDQDREAVRDLDLVQLLFLFRARGDVVLFFGHVAPLT